MNRGHQKELWEVKFTTLERLAKDLSALECEWYDLISWEDAKEDEDFELEYAVREEYKEKYGVARVKYEVFPIMFFYV